MSFKIQMCAFSIFTDLVFWAASQAFVETLRLNKLKTIPLEWINLRKRYIGFGSPTKDVRECPSISEHPFQFLFMCAAESSHQYLWIWPYSMYSNYCGSESHWPHTKTYFIPSVMLKWLILNGFWQLKLLHIFQKSKLCTHLHNWLLVNQNHFLHWQ